MPISSVTTVTTITAAYYNQVKDYLESILSDGYGFMGLDSVDRVAGQAISRAEWSSLVDDFQRVHVHQTNTVFEDQFGVSGEVTASAVNHFTEAITTAIENSSTVALAQLGNSSLTSSTRSIAWTGADLEHWIQITWPSSTAMRQFFNLGSRLRSDLSYTGSDGDWQSYIDQADSRLANGSYGWSEYTNTNTLLYAQGSGTSYIWTSTLAVLAGNPLGKHIKLSAERSSSTITYKLHLDHTGGAVSLYPRHDFYYQYSRGDVAVDGFTGVLAPLPSTVVVTKNFDDDPVIPSEPPRDTKIISATIDSASFTFNQDSTSTTRTITVVNSGNSSVSVSGITYTANGVTAIPNYSGLWGGSAATSIPSGATRTFSLAYTSNQQGSYTNNLTIASDNDSGAITIVTNQTVQGPDYYYTVSPGAISVTLTSTQYAAALLTINQFNGTYYTGPTSYDSGYPNKTGAQASSFVLDANYQAGPLIAFDPAGKANGVYVCSVNISINGVVVNVPISVTLAIPVAVTANLGSWISGIQTTNAVIGFSYDIIQDQRYLTIGFGTGADGSPQITNGSTISGAYAQTFHLTTNSDNLYTLGPVVYPSETDSGSGIFFQDQGVWIRSASLYSGLEQSGPRNLEVSRNYMVSVPTTGDYTWTLSGDYSYSLLIDDVVVFSGVGNYSGTDTESVYIEAGTRKIGWIVSGDKYGPTGMAITLRRTSDNLQIWSTRDAYRPSPPYLNWADVHRIPIAADGTARTYLSKDYLLKSWQLTGRPYEYYFQNNWMIQVDDNGSGELTITFNSNPTVSDDTVYYAHELLYYYSERSVRKSNIGSPEGDGSQTRWFRGFTRDGTVRTSLQSIPVNPPPGGGGGFYEGDQSSTIEQQER